MLAPPVGSSPSFRAVASVCVVTSPNEVEHFSYGLCHNLEWQSTALSLIRAHRFLCQEKSVVSWSCSENACQNPSPSHPFLSSLSPGDREEGEGSQGEGAFSRFGVSQTDMTD